ncbi:Rnf-Nqr domain containing protein, partial [uncultured Brachyspira sp.]
MMNLVLLFVATVLVNNFVLTKFLGICPFLGVSNKLDSAVSMGIAVTFVLVLTAAVSWMIQYYILVPFKIEFLQTILFIIVIAALVQFVEMVVRKTSESLYLSLGIYLPLITTNCCVLGLALFG